MGKLLWTRTRLLNFGRSWPVITMKTLCIEGLLDAGAAADCSPEVEPLE
jgi:hypothetical protein